MKIERPTFKLVKEMCLSDALEYIESIENNDFYDRFWEELCDKYPNTREVKSLSIDNNFSEDWKFDKDLMEIFKKYFPEYEEISWRIYW